MKRRKAKKKSGSGALLLAYDYETRELLEYVDGKLVKFEVKREDVRKKAKS